MELKDTVEKMVSSDYKDRFVAEYEQLMIRFGKLEVMCLKWDKGELDFTPTCPRDIYDRQLKLMDGLLCVLEERAQIENVKLPDKVTIDD